MAAVREHLGYIGREGELELETDEGDRLRGERVAEALIDQWDLDLEEHRRRAELVPTVTGKAPRMVRKLMLSMPAGTQPQGLLSAARSFLKEEFGCSRRYAFVLHTDQPHPHVHVVVKALDDRGVRLRVDRSTLRRWREKFARHLREHGIEANATDRATRGNARQTKKDPIFRATRRGESTHMRRRVHEVAFDLSGGKMSAEAGGSRLSRTRSEVQAGWLALRLLLLKQGERVLADEVRRFVEQMPPAWTEREWLAREIAHRAQHVHSRSHPLTR